MDVDMDTSSINDSTPLPIAAAATNKSSSSSSDKEAATTTADPSFDSGDADSAVHESKRRKGPNSNCQSSSSSNKCETRKRKVGGKASVDKNTLSAIGSKAAAAATSSSSSVSASMAAAAIDDFTFEDTDNSYLPDGRKKKDAAANLPAGVDMIPDSVCFLVNWMANVIANRPIMNRAKEPLPGSSSMSDHPSEKKIRIVANAILFSIVSKELNGVEIDDVSLRFDDDPITMSKVVPWLLSKFEFITTANLEQHTADEITVMAPGSVARKGEKICTINVGVQNRLHPMQSEYILADGERKYRMFSCLYSSIFDCNQEKTFSAKDDGQSERGWIGINMKHVVSNSSFLENYSPPPPSSSGDENDPEDGETAADEDADAAMNDDTNSSSSSSISNVDESVIETIIKWQKAHDSLRVLSSVTDGRASDYDFKRLEKEDPADLKFLVRTEKDNTHYLIEENVIMDFTTATLFGFLSEVPALYSPTILYVKRVSPRIEFMSRQFTFRLRDVRKIVKVIAILVINHCRFREILIKAINDKELRTRLAMLGLKDIQHTPGVEKIDEAEQKKEQGGGGEVMLQQHQQQEQQQQDNNDNDFSSSSPFPPGILTAPSPFPGHEVPENPVDMLNPNALEIEVGLPSMRHERGGKKQEQYDDETQQQQQQEQQQQQSSSMPKPLSLSDFDMEF